MDEAAGAPAGARTFLTEYQRGARAAFLGAVLGLVLALLARRR